MYDFYELGFDNYVLISAIHNTGYNDLLDMICLEFRENDNEYVDDRLKFCIIGRPNVGKSSLMNALLNEERVVVSDVAGTTRDSIDSIVKYNKEEFVVIDTAGMRKRGKIYEAVEKYSLVRSMRAIDRSDICLVVINAEEGIKEHDKHIAGYAIDSGKGLIFVVNKWDQAKDTSINEFTKLMRAEFQFATYAPIVFLSALTKKRINTLMPEVVRVGNNIKNEVKTNVLNDVIYDSYQLNIPPSYKGKRLKIYFTSQTGIKPPKFTFRVNDKGLVHFSYERYLENKIRDNYKKLNESQVQQILRKKYSGWGSLSKKLLTTKYYKDKETELYKSILDLMEETDENFMQIINNDKYNFQQMIQEFNNIEDDKKLNYKLVESLATSPATKRGIYQSLKYWI